MAKRTSRNLIVADLSDNDLQAESQLTDAQEQEAADAFAMAADAPNDFLDGPPAPPKKNRIAEIAEAAERKSREVPITDRLGKPPKAERVIKATAPKPEPRAKAPKELPLCQCGCGDRTGGGKFLPGHDAKLKSRLFTEARSDDDALRVNALQQLSDRNWLHLMGDKKVAKPKATTELTEAARMARILDDLTYFGVGVVERNEIMVLIEKAIDESTGSTEEAV